MSPDTLRKLREWLTLEEAASVLSTALSEDVDASDVLRLVLDERLKLSIYLPAKTTARCRKLGEDAPDAPWTRRTIDGVWMCRCAAEENRRLNTTTKCTATAHVCSRRPQSAL